MNKKIYKTMLSLTIIFLSAMYIIKIFFPEQFMMVIQNETFVIVGEYIITHKWLFYICGIFTSFLTYWLYLCALGRKLYLSIKEVIIVLLTIIISLILNELDVNIAMHFNIISMIALPIIINAKLKDVAIIYGIHGLAQVLSLKIRSLPVLLVSVNFISSLLMIIECYFWLLLFYVIYNNKSKIKE